MLSVAVALRCLIMIAAAAADMLSIVDETTSTNLCASTTIIRVVGLRSGRVNNVDSALLVNFVTNASLDVTTARGSGKSVFAAPVMMAVMVIMTSTLAILMMPIAMVIKVMTMT